MNFSKFVISPLNKNFQFVDNKFLLGKSDHFFFTHQKSAPKNGKFDVILFAVRNISEAKISS